jgi:hypothetical protein
MIYCIWSSYLNVLTENDWNYISTLIFLFKHLFANHRVNNLIEVRIMRPISYNSIFQPHVWTIHSTCIIPSKTRTSIQERLIQTKHHLLAPFCLRRQRSISFLSQVHFKPDLAGPRCLFETEQDVASICCYVRLHLAVIIPIRWNAVALFYLAGRRTCHPCVLKIQIDEALGQQN